MAKKITAVNPHKKEENRFGYGVISKTGKVAPHLLRWTPTGGGSIVPSPCGCCGRPSCGCSGSANISKYQVVETAKQ